MLEKTNREIFGEIYFNVAWVMLWPLAFTLAMLPIIAILWIFEDLPDWYFQIVWGFTKIGLSLFFVQMVFNFSIEFFPWLLKKLNIKIKIL